MAEAAAIAAPGLDTSNSRHWFNHLLVSPSGDRFIFLHRWQGPQHKSFVTRMFTCRPDGKDLYVLDPHGRTSHFIWRDPQHVLAWAHHPSKGEKFYLYKDKSPEVEAIGPDVMTVNGHCSYLPETRNRWILNDTYPDKQRLQHVYLFDTQTGKRMPLGDFLSPREYSGEWRCDTHPRFSRNGRMVCIDSPHQGGRQLYLIDVAGIVA
jgi:Tol biopolymer transport system component